MADVDTSLVSLIDKEIPEGRQALKDGHENLAKVAAYCEQKYLETNTRHKSGSDRAKALEETREVLEETKRFATQSLASVAYQINTLALNMLGLLDQQVMKLQDMESKINHIAETVDIHKEKVARREIGVLAATKPTGRAHRIIAPAEQEKLIRYTRRATDYSVLDNLGHGVKTSDRLDHRHRSSKKLKPQQSQTNKGTSRPVQGTGTTRRTPHVKPPPPPVPPPMPPSVPTAGEFPVPPLPVSESEVPQPPPFAAGIPPPAPPPPGFPSHLPSSDIAPPAPTPVPPTPPPPPPPPGPMMSPPPPPPLPNIGGSPSPSDGTYESVIDALSPFPPPPPPDAEDLYQSPSSLPMPAPPEDMYQTPPPPMDEPPWAPENYIEKVVSLYEYTQQRDDELTFPEGVIIYVIKKNDDGWFEGVSEGGKTGLFPGNYVEVCL